MRLPDLRAPVFCCCMALLPMAAPAQDAGDPKWPDFLRETPEGDYWRLIGSPYTVHYHKDDEGTHRYVYMIGAERQRADGWVWGAVYFSNSFGQSSGYFYLGERVIGFSPWPQLFAQWSVGLLYGYTDPYEDKVPYNYNGFSPGATLSLGWQFTRNFSMQMNALGAAALMFQLSWDFR